MRRHDLPRFKLGSCEDVLAAFDRFARRCAKIDVVQPVRERRRHILKLLRLGDLEATQQDGSVVIQPFCDDLAMRPDPFSGLRDRYRCSGRRHDEWEAARLVQDPCVQDGRHVGRLDGRQVVSPEGELIWFERKLR